MQKDLVSKLMAGGLSAAVVLVWWAAYFPATGVTTWLTRGLAMTLLYEVLYLSFSPLERHLWKSRVAVSVSVRVERWQERLQQAPDRRRVHGSVALACVATLVPILLLSAGVRHDPPASAAAPSVRDVTINHETVVRTRAPAQQVIVERTVATAPAVTRSLSRTVVIHSNTTRTVVLRVTSSAAPIAAAVPIASTTVTAAATPVTTSTTAVPTSASTTAVTSVISPNH